MNEENIEKKSKGGRPKGAKNKRTLEINGQSIYTSELRLSKDEKLAILASVAKDPSTTNGDKIKAIMAYTDLSGDTSDGFKSYILKIIMDK